jgi:hypothetical protein
MTSILRALGIPVEGGEVCSVLWIRSARCLAGCRKFICCKLLCCIFSVRFA